MSGENEHPNPVEDYMKQIMETNKLDADGSVSVPAAPEEINRIMEKALKRRKPVFNPTGRIEQIDDGEVEIADIRRHPIGLSLLYVQFIVAATLSLGLLVFFLPEVVGNSAGTNLFIGVLTLIMSVLGIIFLILATRIYKGNQLIVTDQHVTEVQQIGLFNRRVSELSMANIEDVTANTHGFLSTMFNFGTLTVETANEQHNFVFRNCPNPNAYAKAIQDCRSAYLEKHGSGHGI